MSAEKTKLRVDVISDVVCPWCYLGKRHLERAIEQVADRFDVEVEWHPFQLNPDMPREGRDWAEYVTERFGSMDRLREGQARLIQAGKAQGIDYAFEKVSRAVNTLDAHRLIWFAKERGGLGKQDEVAEALFAANFLEGRDVGDRGTLLEIAEKAGLDRAEVEEMLGSKSGEEQVQFSEMQARQLGVSGVPFFIAGGKHAVSGAQPVEVLVSLLERAASDPAQP